jgi:hypothetical protein
MSSLRSCGGTPDVPASAGTSGAENDVFASIMNAVESYAARPAIRRDHEGLGQWEKCRVPVK